MKEEKEKAFLPIATDRVEHVTLSLTLDTRKREEKLPVAVRINANRQTIYHRTGLRCTLEKWEEIRISAKRGEKFEQKKDQLKIYEKVRDQVKELLKSNAFTFDNLKSKLTGKNGGTFSQTWIDIANSKKVGTREAYLIAYNSFEKYVGKNIPFARIGIALIDKWETGMRKDGLSNTTIGMYFRACRVMIKECIRTNKLKPNQYPFGKESGLIKIKKGRSRKEEFVDIPTIKKLMTFVAPETWLRSYSGVVYEAIAMWMFSYLGNGLNLADMAILRYERHYFESGGTELKFIRQKTIDTTDEDIEVIIPVIPELKRILDKYGSVPEMGGYVFPQILNGQTDPDSIKKAVAQWNSNIRDRVQVACGILGISKNVSMTWARHSFATNLTNAGVTERYISQAMGHTTKSVTQGYIGLFPPEKRMEFNKKLLDK